MVDVLVGVVPHRVRREQALVDRRAHQQPLVQELIQQAGEDRRLERRRGGIGLGLDEAGEGAVGDLVVAQGGDRVRRRAAAAGGEPETEAGNGPDRERDREPASSPGARLMPPAPPGSCGRR